MERPNILWFISDDTSAGALGYKGGRALTPNIDRVARNGVVFDNFFCASPACTPSRYNYLTGRYGGRCPAVTKSATAGEPHCLFFNTHLDPEHEHTIAHALQRAGYRTGHVGKWHAHASAADVAGIPPLDKDADVRDPAVQVRMRAQQQYLCAVVRKAGFDYAASVVWGNHESLPDAAKNHNLEWTTKGALDFIDGAATDGMPFFLSMATTTIHGPNHVSSLLADPRLTGAGISDAHLGCQASRASIYERLAQADGVEFNSTTAGALWMDDALGAVLERLRARGMAENTIVIVSTDHGPSDSGGGKFSVYDAGVRIPFCLQWQGVIPGGRRVAEFAQNIDLPPTLLELAGVESSSEFPFDGRSLSALLLGQTDTTARAELFFEFGYARAVRTARWKYIACRLPSSLLDPIRNGERDVLHTQYGKPIRLDVVNPTLQTPTLHNYPHYFDPDQLYDLENDPGETRNLASDPTHAGILAELSARLRAHLDTFATPFPLDHPDPFFTSPRCDALKRSLWAKLEHEYPAWRADAKYIGFLR